MSIVQICTPLDVLDKQIVLLAGNKVGAHDPRLLTSRHNAGEDATESVESTLVRRWHHLGDIHHQRTLWITALHSCSCQTRQFRFINNTS